MIDLHTNLSMTIQEFLFADKSPIRLTRHLTFWGLYILLFYGQGLVQVQNKFFNSFISVLTYVPAVVLSVYVFTQILCPLLQRKKYFSFVTGFSILFVAIWIVNSLGSLVYFHFTCDCSVSSVKFGALVGLTSINSTHAVAAGGMVFGYKIGKERFLKQLENQRLAQQKIDRELVLQKARLCPAFLFHSLNSVYSKILSSSPDAPEIILKLSDILSYMLYESDEESVTLEKEMSMINNFVQLENVNQSRNVSIPDLPARARNKMVKPLVILPVLLECFHTLANYNDELHADVQLACGDDQLKMNILFFPNKPGDISTLSYLVTDVRQRLNYLHQKKADVNIYEDSHGAQVQLNILFEETGGKRN